MEIRRDPITQSWVVQGQKEALDESSRPCPFDGAAIERQTAILTWPGEGPWQVRVVPHPDPLYRIEGEQVCAHLETASVHRCMEWGKRKGHWRALPKHSARRSDRP